ncbi:MAG TPA: hypothetical protein VGQ04_08845, partial [Chitinophagaceae bacterium]|nr:hypothetical protein [Chitinophagaceae bacterium]
QKQKMCDTKNEFHLEHGNSGEYLLSPVHNAYYVHEQKIKQPGEPTFSTYEFNNPSKAQPLSFIITMPANKESDADVSFDDLSIAINQQDVLNLPVHLKQKQILYCDGKTIKLFNNQWQLIQTIELHKSLPLLTTGRNEIKFDGKFSGENGAPIKIEVRVKSDSERLNIK